MEFGWEFLGGVVPLGWLFHLHSWNYLQIQKWVGKWGYKNGENKGMCQQIKLAV